MRNHNFKRFSIITSPSFCVWKEWCIGLLIQITVYSTYFENSEYTLTKLKKLHFSKASRCCFRNLTKSQKMRTFFLNIFWKDQKARDYSLHTVLEYNLVKIAKRHHVSYHYIPILDCIQWSPTELAKWWRAENLLPTK